MLVIREPYVPPCSCARKRLKRELWWPSGSHTTSRGYAVILTVEMLKSMHLQRGEDARRLLNHGSWHEWSGRCVSVCVWDTYYVHACVVFAPHHWCRGSSPHRQLISGLTWVREGENGRKSDPYGGTIKLAASSKPGQDWPPPFTPALGALNSAAPQLTSSRLKSSAKLRSMSHVLFY